MATAVRRRASVDKNQSPIVKALREIGATVVTLHIVGKGCPDLLVGFRMRTYLMEIKCKGGRLTEDQRFFHHDWRGNPILTVHSIEEALEEVGYLPGKPKNRP